MAREAGEDWLKSGNEELLVLDTCDTSLRLKRSCR